VLDNLATGRREHVHPAATFIQADVTDPRLARRLAGERFDAVAHQAAQVSVPRSVDEPRFDAQVNLVGTMNLMEYACSAGVKRFVFASSAAVYGSPTRLPVAENTPTHPQSPYAESKLAAEDYLRRYSGACRMRLVVLRYANVYGPRQRAHGESGVVCALMSQILAGRPAVINGDGMQTRDFVYVSDVAEANVLALRSDATAGVYNVGTAVATRILDLHALLAGPDAAWRHGPPRSGDVRHSVLDTSAIRAGLGWQPAVSLADGLAHTWRYFVSNPDNGLRPPATPNAISRTVMPHV